MTISLAGLTTTFAGLNPQTTYYLALAAVNGGGIVTPASAILSAATLPNPAVALSEQWTIGPAGGTIVFNAPTGPITVVIPTNAFLQPTILTLSLPTGFPASPAGVVTAAGTGIGFQITADQPIQPGSEFTVSVSYRPSDVAGQGTADLSLASYDDNRGVWVPLVSDVDTMHQTVTSRTYHFSLYQIMQVAPSNTVATAKAFPNPLRPAQGQTSMTFADLPAGARIRIYDFLGELVRDLTADESGMASWDGTNQSGRKAASGIYFVFAQGDGGHKTLKVAIQR
jgi:hypothetical protein